MRKYDEISEGIIRYGVEIDTDAVKKQEILAAIDSDYASTLTSIADVCLCANTSSHTHPAKSV